MNVTAQVLDKVEKSTTFPVLVTNKDFPIITESALIVQALEGEGYKVSTFVDLKTETYGLRIEK